MPEHGSACHFFMLCRVRYMLSVRSGKRAKAESEASRSGASRADRSGLYHKRRIFGEVDLRRFLGSLSNPGGDLGGDLRALLQMCTLALISTVCSVAENHSLTRSSQDLSSLEGLGSTAGFGRMALPLALLRAVGGRSTRLLRDGSAILSSQNDCECLVKREPPTLADEKLRRCLLSFVSRLASAPNLLA